MLSVVSAAFLTLFIMCVITNIESFPIKKNEGAGSITFIPLGIFFVWNSKNRLKGCWDCFYNTKYPRSYVFLSFFAVLTIYGFGIYGSTLALFIIYSKATGYAFLIKALIIFWTAVVLVINYTRTKISEKV